jgi:hypothetical protein
MELPTRIFPIGIQSFEQLRTRNYLYADKTDLVYQMDNTNQVYFLSRPRRFGKSLLLSTLKVYFEGKKHLFEGLAMERLETEWTAYPVPHISFARNRRWTRRFKSAEGGIRETPCRELLSGYCGFRASTHHLHNR